MKIPQECRRALGVLLKAICFISLLVLTRGTFTVMLPLIEESVKYVAKPTIIRRRAMR